MTKQSKPSSQTEVTASDAPLKSHSALREEEVLAFWRDNNIFDKTLAKDAPLGNFVFFDGPPYATGMPHFGHMIPSTVKDVIPRYKTMRGYRVPRRWGWDCHGLPIENLIEKELGLSDKKAIEEYGIEKFNKAARDSVFRYRSEWRRVVDRVGRWADMDNDYHTMDASYTESVWWSFSELNKKGRVYEAYKVMNYCPRCQTPLSNFEVGQGYRDIPDISAYVLFPVVTDSGIADTNQSNRAGENFLAWTTTPWTLPGNVALALHPELEYSLVETTISSGKDNGKEDGADTKKVKVWIASDLVQKLVDKNILNGVEILKKEKGSTLKGIKYNPPFDFYSEVGSLPQDQETKRENIWKTQNADFVTAEDGTGIVHIAPAFGDDDYKLSVAENLPIILHVSSDGHIKEENGTLSGLQAKPKGDHQSTDIEVIKLLAHKYTDGASEVSASNAPLLFAKEKITHSYAHCWRCDTPLLNYPTSSWFVKVADYSNELVVENKNINWTPKEIGEGRFGKWLEGARDWAVSRTRFWGAPIPVWRGEKSGQTEFIGSVEDLKSKIKSNGNDIILMRHGEAESNIKDVINSNPKDLDLYGLTEKGKHEVGETIKKLEDLQTKRGKKITKIFASDFRRTRETAELVKEHFSKMGNDIEIILDHRLREINAGDFDAGSWGERAKFFNNISEKVFKKNPNGEAVFDVKTRTAEFLYEIESKHKDEMILVVTHGLPLRMMINTSRAKTARDLIRSGWQDISDPTASIHEINFKALPHNENFELDIHRPYIDEVTWENEFVNKEGQKELEIMRRVQDVFDVWYDSGAMPFASAHYPFENQDSFESGKIFPADFIAEGLDQTRGWFYSLIVLGVSLFGKSPYKNVSVNGLMLAEDGRKMSKSLKNYPDIEPTFDKYGVDSLRYYISSSPAVHGEEVLFGEKFLDEINKKIFNRLDNVYSFYQMYGGDNAVWNPEGALKSQNVLDQWIISRLSEVKVNIEKGLDSYQIDKASRPIGELVDDISTWYLRRSRDRFKGEDESDKNSAMFSTQYVLLTLMKLMAPFTPFYAEHMYQKLLKLTGTMDGNESATASNGANKDMPESVHLCDWPNIPEADMAILESMKKVRELVETGLAMRSKASVKVRQPLSSFTYNTSDLNGKEISDQFAGIIADELNVKKVLAGSSNELDINITDDLKQEGVVREIIRAVQEIRKNNKLIPSDAINLSIKCDASHIDEVKDIIAKFESLLTRPILAQNVSVESVEDVSSVEGVLDIDGLKLSLSIERV